MIKALLSNQPEMAVGVESATLVLKCIKTDFLFKRRNPGKGRLMYLIWGASKCHSLVKIQ